MPIFTQETYRHLHHRPPPQYLSRSQRKFILFFLKCVVMVAVISIFLFFLGFAAAVLLHFLFTSNTFHRRCTRLFHPSSAADETTSDEAVPNIQTLIPEVTYTAAAFPAALDCAICLDLFQEGDNCRKLMGCKHLFHSKCVDRWIKKRPTCPVCRTRVDFDPSGCPGWGIDGDDQWKRLWGVNFEEGTSY